MDQLLSINLIMDECPLEKLVSKFIVRVFTRISMFAPIKCNRVCVFSEACANPIHSGFHQWGIGSLAARFCPGNGWEMISGSNDCTLKVWSVNDELGFQNCDTFLRF